MYKKDFSEDKLIIYRDQNFSSLKEKNAAIGLSCLIFKIFEGNKESLNGCDYYELKETFDKIFETFTKTEQIVISERFGLDGETPKTLSQIAHELELSKQRILQIQENALQKLSTPSISNTLKNIFFPIKIFENRIKQLENDNETLKNQITSLQQNTEILITINEKLEERIMQLENKVQILNYKNTPIIFLNLSVRSFNCLKRSNIDTIGQLAECSKKKISSIQNLGKNSAKEIISKLAKLGITLRDE